MTSVIWLMIGGCGVALLVVAVVAYCCCRSSSMASRIEEEMTRKRREKESDATLTTLEHEQKRLQQARRGCIQGRYHSLEEWSKSRQERPSPLSQS